MKWLSSLFNRWFLLQIWSKFSNVSHTRLSLSLSLRSRLNTYNWLIHRNIWQIKYIKTLKIIINYNKYHSIFSIYSTQAKERIRCSTVSPSFANKEFVYNLLFSTYELIDDHRFRERRYIIYTCKLSTYKLNNWLNLS